MKILLFTIFLFVLAQLRAQDTVSVYFDFGISKIRDDQFDIINAIPVVYDLSDLDSIHFLGMADSIGGIEPNIKLSEKRAKNVAKYCQNLFPKMPIRISALGEKSIEERAKNRRVDIILYYKFNDPEPNDETEPDDTTDIAIVSDTAEEEEHCYYVSYNLLNSAHIRTIEKKKQQQTLIELESSPGRKPKYYYSSRTEEGKFKSNKITWRTKRTGKLWWKKTRYVATIPKESFDKNKIFTIEDTPCDSCSEYFQSKPVITKGHTCLQTDDFLMNNLQYKTKLFNKTSVKIRVPREYVNIEYSYYKNNDTTAQIQWETKPGKRNQNYYFATLPVLGNHLRPIKRQMICCNRRVAGEGYGGCVLFPSGGGFDLLGEIGNHYQQKTNTPYAALGISKEYEYSRIAFFAGTDTAASFYASLRYQYHFLSFPLNPVSIWVAPTLEGVYKRYWRVYLGTEIKTKLDNKSEDYLEQNIHLGIASVKYKPSGLNARYFLQYGYGNNYLKNKDIIFYPIIQLGVSFTIQNIEL